jgi:signal peptidase
VDPISGAWIKFRSWEWRDGVQQALNLATIVLSALMIWKSLMLATGSESPVVVVLSGSMEPTMWRGDILALWMPDQFEVGDIVVFNINDREIPIIHRVIQTHIDENGEIRILTKGDNNQVDDAYGIYAPKQMWLRRKDLMGKAVVYVPQAGFLTIWINETPIIKYIVIGAMCIYVLFFDDSTQ